MTTPSSRRLRLARSFKGLTQSQLADLAKVEQQVISRVETGRKFTSHIFKIANALGVAADWLSGEMGLDDQIIFSESGLNMIPIDSTVGGTKVRGAVAAAIWNEASEWPEEEWYEIPKPILQRYSSKDCYALLVEGDSMNKTPYKNGVYAYCIPLENLGRDLKTGDFVIVQREDCNEYETTIKQIEFGDSGKVMLWPRSDHRDHQNPFVISNPKIANRSDNMVIKVIAFVVGFHGESD